MPERAIKPTAAEIEKGIPLIHKLKIPPVKARGTAEKINSAHLTELTAANRSMKIIKKHPGTTQ